MTEQDRRRIIAEYNEELRRLRSEEYFNFRSVDPTNPDCRPAIEEMVDNHPNPAKSRKGLCFDLKIHDDSLRKYLANRFGPPYGMIDRLMSLTGCYKPLYWLARRHGFILVPESILSWDRRRKLMTAEELQRAWLDLHKLHIDLMDHKSGSKPGIKTQKTQRKLRAHIRLLQEQLAGLLCALDNLSPQMDLFDREEQ